MAVRCVPFGSEATRTLRSLIADAKASDPCAAVTVAVSSVPAAVQLRRALAEGGRPEGAGLFNVRVVTLSSLARQLVAGAELCPGPARWALIRRLLEEDPGPLEACRDHPELPLALSRAFDAMAASDRPSGPLEPMWRRYREAIAGLGLADPPSLAERLPDRLPPDLGTVVVHLPKPPARSEEALLRKLERAGAVLVLGATGDERADAWLHRWCPSVPAVRPAVAETLLACTDAEEEVREAVRAVWRWAEQGVPLERCAILFRRRHPYARVAFDVLREARLPAYGRSPLQLWDSLVGLTVGVALEAAQGGFDADRLFDWLAAARPRTPEGEAASVEAWRRLVRELGVETNLPALLRWLGKRSGAEAASFLRFLEHWFDACRTLFASSSGEPWAARVRALLDWVDALVPDQSLPEPERRLKERWRAKVTELKSAAAAQPEVDGPGFAWQVRQTLRGDGRAPGRLGTGVFVGTFEEARGMDLDAVALVGLAEGVCPTIVRGDPILGLVPGALPPIAEQVDRERELYLAALATGAKARMATFPRVDRVDGSGFLPSRWIGDQLRSQGRGTEDYERAPSFERRVFEGGFASPQELLAASRPIGRSARWQERMQERESDQPGPHTGFVAPMPERLGSPISVTAAADLFACPQRFFLKDVLRVAETEAPREESSVDPRRLGSALHSALSGFLGALPAAEWPEEWQDAHKLQLQRMLEAELDRLEQAGWVRRPALWRLEKEAILRLVPLLLDMEARVRAGCKPVDVKTELWCGGAEGPVRVAAGSDQIQLEGRMDLVEVFEAEVAVMDVKLGGPVRALDQVRLYLRMLEETHPGKQARGAYLPLRAGGEPTLVDWTESERSGLDRKLAEAAGHIAAGRFPLLPNLESGEGESNCARCAYRRLCPTDRGVLQEIYRDWADQALGVAPEAEPEEGADA